MSEPNADNPRARISLRPAGEQDEPFLLRVYAATRTKELSQVPWSDAQKQAFVRMQSDAQILHYRSHYPGAQFQVILLDGEPVGRLYLAKLESELRILDIAVVPERRKMGIGTLVLEGVRRDASDMGLTVTIFVEPYNQSLQLFERLGFSRIHEDAFNILMEWKP